MPRKRKPAKTWKEQIEQALIDQFNMEGYTRKEVLAELFYDYGIRIVDEGLTINGYDTRNYNSKNQMVEFLTYEAEELHESNWWDGITDEDDFCDCEAGDDPEYMSIMGVVSLVEDMSRELEGLLW